jgi:hypothetical protein
MKQITFYLIVVLSLSACDKQEPEDETLVDDRFEENDSQKDAAFLEEGFTYTSLTISDDDDDWYLILLSADSIKIICKFIHEEGDINLEIVDERGDSITSAISETNNEALNFIDDEVYNLKKNYIHVYTSSPSLQKYSLWWDDTWSVQMQ